MSANLSLYRAFLISGIAKNSWGLALLNKEDGLFVYSILSTRNLYIPYTKCSGAFSMIKNPHKRSAGCFFSLLIFLPISILSNKYVYWHIIVVIMCNKLSSYDQRNVQTIIDFNWETLMYLSAEMTSFLFSSLTGILFPCCIVTPRFITRNYPIKDLCSISHAQRKLEADVCSTHQSRFTERSLPSPHPPKNKVLTVSHFCISL